MNQLFEQWNELFKPFLLNTPLNSKTFGGSSRKPQKFPDSF